MSVAPRLGEEDQHIDWQAAEESSEFRELIRKQKAFVIPCTVFFFAWYFGFVILAGYAPDFMGRRSTRGFTVGYLLALTQFVMVWVLGWMYLRKADRDFDPLRAAPPRGRSGPRPAAPRRMGARDERPGRRQRRGHRDLLGRRSASRCASPTGRRSGRRPRRTSGPRAAGSAACRTGSRSPGDYMSAASFLGIAGLIFLFGFDGFLYSVGFLVAFLTVLFLLAERMRNAGKFTIADVLAFRLRERPARMAAALGTLAVAGFYLIAQMVGAGALIEALVGIDYNLAILLTGIFMLAYVIFGGMIATTWVQIVKAVLLMTGATVMSLFVLERVGFNPIDLFNARRHKRRPRARSRSRPGTFLSSPIDTVSLGIALVLGTAGLPHILMRFFTVPDAKAARTSVVWAIGLIGAFYIMTTFLGFGARAFLGEEGVAAAGSGREPRGAEPGAASWEAGSARRAATPSWPSSRRWRSRRSWRWSRAS